MDHLRGNLREWDEDEATLVQARVRQCQLRGVEDHGVEQEEIKIERARCVGEGASAAQIALDREQRVEKVGGSQRGLQRDDRVQKSRLLQVPNRLRLVETRDPRDATQ